MASSDSTDTTEEEKRESVVRWRICAAVTILIVLLTAASVAMRPSFHAGDLVAIKNLHTGKYLAVGTDGLVRASAETSAEPAARFRLLGLDSKFLQAMGALHAKAPQKNLGVGGKLGCPCSGESDEHGFGRFCHNWESEFHRPWCYVSATCSHGVRSKRHTSKLLQVCGMEEGYLGPEGWEAAPGCACTGHESVHGFGAFCKGWEFAGQTPWCYVQEECDGAMGTDGARFTDCVPTDAFSPPPPPPPPIGPLVESKGGWGTPAGCLCSGWSNKHGFGAHCEGWEVEGQIPWCYVHNNCTVPTTGGSFKRRYLQCIEMPDAGLPGRRLNREIGAVTEMPAVPGGLGGRRVQEGERAGGEHGPSSMGDTAAMKKAGKAAGMGVGKGAMHAPGRPVGDKKTLKTALLPGVKASDKVRARLPGASSGLKARPSKREVSWAAMRAGLRLKAMRMPRFALRSELSGGFVNIDPPPHSNALFAHSAGDAAKEPLSLSSAFALPRSGVGAIFAFGSDALLSLCQTAEHQDWVACTATPVLLRAPKAIDPTKASAHHRKLLVSVNHAPTAQFVVEVLDK